LQLCGHLTGRGQDCPVAKRVASVLGGRPSLLSLLAEFLSPSIPSARALATSPARGMHVGVPLNRTIGRAPRRKGMGTEEGGK
jgi:hypothetical protein